MKFALTKFSCIVIIIIIIIVIIIIVIIVISQRTVLLTSFLPNRMKSFLIITIFIDFSLIFYKGIDRTLKMTDAQNVQRHLSQSEDCVF